MESAWQLILQQGVAPAIMAIFCYATYRYFTTQNDKLYDRIVQKDELIQKLYAQHLEMTQMFIKTQLDLANQVNDVVNITMTIDAKLDDIKKNSKSI